MKKLFFFLIIFLFAITSLSFVNYDNNFKLFKLNFSFNPYIYQFIYNVDNLNNLLNDGILDINKINSFRVGIFGNTHASASIKIGKFSLTPFAELDMNLLLSIPDDLFKFLTNDIEIDKTYEYDEIKIPSYSNTFLNIGVALKFNNLSISPYVYTPVIYISEKDQKFYFKYTSSSSPSKINLELNYDLIGYIPINTESENEAKKSPTGIAASLGYSNSRLGIFVNNITIKPITLPSAKLLRITTDATYENLSFEIVDTNLEVKSIDKEIKISPKLNLSGYYNFKFLADFHLEGMYYFDRSYTLSAEIYKKIFFLIPFYKFGYYSKNSVFSNTLGLGIDLILLKSNFGITITSDKIIPSKDSYQGFGVAFNFEFGI